MSNYPYTQADYTPRADKLANEIGACRAELGDLKMCQYIFSKYNEDPNDVGLKNEIDDLEKHIHKLESILKKHSFE